MEGKAGQDLTSGTPVGTSTRVANILKNLNTTNMTSGYAPEQVGVLVHKADEPGVLWLDIEYILDSPYQHQEHLDPADFQALVESIQKEGFLTALNVNEHPQRRGYYFLTAGGHQRRDAARAAGQTRLPVFVEPPLDPIRLAFRAAKENVVRVNSSPVNLGYLFMHIQDEFGLTQEEIASELGKARTFVNRCIMAARSDPDIQDLLAKKPDSLRAMIYLRRLTSPEDRAPLIAKLCSRESSTDGVKAEVEAILQQRKIQASRFSLNTSMQSETAMREAGYKWVGSLAPGPDAKEGIEAGGRGEGSQKTGGVTGVMGQKTPEQDPYFHERVGKLRDIIGRLQNYQRLLGGQPLSHQEQIFLGQIASTVGDLLTSRQVS